LETDFVIMNRHGLILAMMCAGACWGQRVSVTTGTDGALVQPSAAAFRAANDIASGTFASAAMALAQSGTVKISEVTVSTSGSTGIDMAGQSYTALTLGTAAAPYTRTVSLVRGDGRFARIFATWADQNPTLEVYDSSPSGTMLFSGTNAGRIASGLLEFYRTSGSTAWRAAGPNFVFSSGTATPIVTGSMLAFYRLSNGTDQAGNFTMTENGTAFEYVTGKIGNCYHSIPTEGVTDACLTNDALDLAGLDAFTVTAWCNPESGSDISVPIGKWSGGATQFVMVVSAGGASFNVNTTSGGEHPASISDTIADWCFVAARLTSGTLQVRLNGGAWESAAAPGIVVSSTVAATIGGFNPGISASDLKAGYYDAIGVWNYALSDAEIDALYLSGTGAEF
jgi:hypothetical protein